MKKLIIISLIILSIAFFVQGLISKKKYTKYNEQLLSYCEFLKNNNSFLEYLIQLKINFENVELGELILINEHSEVIDDSFLTNKLIIYQSDFNCTPCDSYIWENLTLLKNSILDSTILITSLKSYNSAKSLLLSMKLNFKDILVDKDSFFSEMLNNKNNTMFLMIDHNRKMHDLYLVNNNLSESLRDYFRIMNIKY